MIHVTLTLRLFGELATEFVMHAHPDAPFVADHLDRHGEGGVSLPLAEWRVGPGADIAEVPHRPLASEAVSSPEEMAIARLRALAPMLKALDSSRYQADISLKIVRSRGAGNAFFLVPSDVVAAAGAAGLALGITVVDGGAHP